MDIQSLNAMQMANVIRLEAFMDNHQTQGYLMKTITKLLVQLEVSLNYLTFRGGFNLVKFAFKKKHQIAKNFSGHKTSSRLQIRQCRRLQRESGKS
jgi:hypothetical protein